MKRENWILRRLKSRVGETIVEVLIATLISALGMAILAGMIAASTNIINGSRETAAAYLEHENALEDRGGASEAGTVTFRNNGVTNLKLTDDADSDEVPVEYISRKIGKATVIAYSRKN
jgi:Tfp pilus assembly protein PilV